MPKPPWVGGPHRPPVSPPIPTPTPLPAGVPQDLTPKSIVSRIRSGLMSWGFGFKPKPGPVPVPEPGPPTPMKQTVAWNPKDASEGVTIT